MLQQMCRSSGDGVTAVTVIFFTLSLDAADGVLVQ
jgi:hypothetical protein